MINSSLRYKDCSTIDKIDNDKLTPTNQFEIIKGLELWEILMSEVNIKMNNTYTSEEVFERLKKLEESHRKNHYSE